MTLKNIFALSGILFFLQTTTIFASEPKIWTIDTRAEILKGEAKGVSIDENGTVTLAPKLTEVFKTEQSYIWSSAIDAAGNVYLGTGSDGRIYKVDATGKGSLFYDSTELNVSALAVGKSGELYAGTSPDGKVYRIDASGNATVFFEPKEKYIWSLEVLPDGSLAVGTGENGKIYRVKTAGALPATSLFSDTSETHITSLASDKQGNLYAGTDSGGLVLRFAPDGKAFALLDSTLREIHDLAVGADGSVYALALSETITAPKTEPTTTTVPTDTMQVQSEQPPKSRYDLSTAKSAVYRIFPDGGSDIIWNSSTVAAFSIYAHQTGSGVLIGTSDKGRIYNASNDGRETLVLQSNEGQISTVFTNGQSLFATSSNQGKLYRFGSDNVTEGIYESSVLDAKASADWGRIWWRASGNVTIQTRSGNTEKPNETWSDWSVGYLDQKGAQVASPKTRFLQWRAVLNGEPLPKGTNFGTGLSTNVRITLNEVNVSYLPRNIAPEILSIQVLPTNVGLQANPPMQIDPNIENSGLDLSAFGLQNPAIPPRRIYQRGARSLLWTAEDRNGDRLEYNIYYREVSETNFKLLRENLREAFFTIDGSALADGRYIFKIAAKDSLSNPIAQALSGERTTEPVDIDNTPPTVSAVGTPTVSGDKTRVVFDASDAASFLTKAEISVDGSEWQAVYSDDGISDGGRERYTLDIPINSAGEHTITLRVFDVNGNVGSARVSVRK
jgi:sugar lactone lactonase YvrE